MSTIRVRMLDANRDPVYGNGVDAYLFDIEAVAQIIQTRLMFYKGEWWEDTNLGLPMWQSILGQSGKNKTVIDQLIRKQIAETPYVNYIMSFTSTLENRVYTCQVEVATDFGTILVTNGSV